MAISSQLRRPEIYQAGSGIPAGILLDPDAVQNPESRDVEGAVFIFLSQTFDHVTDFCCVAQST